MADSRVRIGSDGALSPDDVARRSFGTSRRGFDPSDVRGFLEAVAGELRRLHQRIEELESGAAPASAPLPASSGSAAAAWESTAAPPSPPALDIATLTTALGEETARVLRVAQEAAVDLRARAEEGAQRALTEAHEEAARVRGRAETLLAERTEEADAMATKLRVEVEAEVAQLKARAEAETEAAIHAAVERGREMVGEAQAARERMLTDLARRRRTALGQLEALRAGRERLLSAYRAVRTSLDEITAELERADREVSIAAEARRPPSGTWNEEAAIADLELPEAATPSAAAPSATAPSAATPSATAPSAAAPEAAPGAKAPPPASLHAAPTILPSTPGDLAPIAALPSSAVGEAPEAPADAEPAAAPSSGDVEELFARIRADRADTTVKALETLADSALEAGSSAPAAAGDSPGAGADAEAADHAGAGEESRSDGDEQLLHRRDEIIDPLAAQLSKKLKRLLQDEQNVVLDRIRTQRGKVTAEMVLPELATHGTPYRDEAITVLQQVERAGAELAAAIGTVTTDIEPQPDALIALADGLAFELLEPLRQRFERLLSEGAGEDQSTATDAVSSAYREIKARRIERAVGDRLTGALTLGIARALPAGTGVRWLVDDVDGPCPDCDDNALAGSTALGEEFPTGQLGPPAHPGCRCLLGPPSA